MIVTLGVTHCRVQGTEAERTWLAETLRVRAPGYEFSSKYRRGLWDGYIRFYSRMKFPTGLLPLVVRRAKKAGHHLSVPPATPPHWAGRMPALAGTLRPYQQQAVKRCLTNTVAGTDGAPPAWFPRALVWAPTGSGKSLIMAALAQAIPGRTLLIVHRRTIFADVVKELVRALDEPIGRIGAGHMETSRRVTVAMVQTLAPLITPTGPWLPTQDALIIDEAHHADADIWDKVFTYAKRAYVRFGVSAKPFRARQRLQQWRVTGHLGPVVLKKSIAELTDQGYLAPVTYLSHRIQHLGLSGFPYELAYERAIIESPVRNALIEKFVRACQAQREGALVLVRARAHGQRLHEQLTGSAYVHGDTPEDERALAWQLLEQHGVVVATIGCVGEGTNLPTLHRLVLAAGGESDIEFLQAVGRAMRRPNPNDRAIVLDFDDEGNTHLARHSASRKTMAAQLGFAVRCVNP